MTSPTRPRKAAAAKNTETPEAETPTAPAEPATSPSTPPAPAAAPLAPPSETHHAPAAPLVAPVPPVPANTDAFLGYVTDGGDTIDPDDLFNMSGSGVIVTARLRSHAQIRRGNSRTKLQTLAFTEGEEVNRATAVAAIKAARAAADS